MNVNDSRPEYFEIDLIGLMQTIWSGKLLILLAGSLAASLSYYYVGTLPDVYRATAIVMPAENQNAQLSGVSSQYSGLASLAGFNLPQGGRDPSEVAVKIMTSQSFVRELDAQHNLAPYFFAVRKWNRESSQLIFNDGIYDQETETWNIGKDNKSSRPRDHDVYSAFMSALTIEPDKNSRFTRISISHASPKFAQRLVNILIDSINKNLRARDITNAEKSVKFLREQAENSALADLNVIIYGLVEMQIRTMMLAKTREDYVFEVIDPPTEPIFPEGPARKLLVAISAMVGLLLGVFIRVLVFVRRELEGSRGK